MADLTIILNEHRELLKARGYQEIGLGTSEKPKNEQGYEEMEFRDPEQLKKLLKERDYEETRIKLPEPDAVFIQQLEKLFSNCLKESLFEKGDREFDVKAVGVFNKEQHLLEFIFHYHFDAHRQQFEIKSLKASSEGITKEFILPNMYELPHARNVVAALLKEQRQKEGSTVLTDREKIDSFEKNLKTNQNWLESRGYLNKQYFPYRTDYLSQKLKDNLASVYREKDLNEDHDFYITTQGYFNNEDDEVSFHLSFSFNGEEKALRPNALIAELNGKKILYPVKEIKDLPQPFNAWKCLTNKSRQSNAILIYPKDRIKMLLREQERFLGVFGYYDTVFTNKSMFIERQLQSQMEYYLHERGLRNIPIEQTIHLDQHHSIDLLFQYSFDPILVDLSLDKITARLDGIENKYFPGDWQTMITVQQMHKELSKQVQLSKVNPAKRAKAIQDFHDSRRNRRQRL